MTRTTKLLKRFYKHITKLVDTLKVNKKPNSSQFNSSIGVTFIVKSGRRSKLVSTISKVINEICGIIKSFCYSKYYGKTYWAMVVLASIRILPL